MEKMDISEARSREAVLPLEVYESVVRSLHGDLKTLVAGKFASCLAALFAYSLTKQPLVLLAAAILIATALVRLFVISRFHKLSLLAMSAERLKRSESIYKILSTAYLGAMGMACFVTLAVSDNQTAQLIIISATLANIAGISGRNFASESVVNLQVLGVSLPLVMGLLLFGSGYHALLAVLLLPFLVAIRSISSRLRAMLFDATFVAIDHKKIAARFEIALQNASHGMAMIDRSGAFQVVNCRFNELFGIPLEHKTLGSGLHHLAVFELASRGGLGVEECLSEKIRVCQVEGKRHKFSHMRTDGSVIQVTFNPMDDGACVIVLEDVSEQVKSEQEIRQLANFDALTHLPNRHHFASLIKDRNRDWNTQQFTIFFIDLDNFKNINDSLGHPVGDKLLCAASLRLKACIPENGIICRFGGDEFLIFLPDVSAVSDCEKFARRLIDEVSKPILIDGHLIIAGASAGIARCPENDTEMDQLLKKADVALYEAKSKGRGTYNFYSEELGDKIKNRRKLEVDLRRAVQRGQLTVHYQPIVDVKEEVVTCCEALVRWKHPELGSVSPAEFIPMAEEIGIISKIGRFVLEEATRECMHWPDGIRVAVNVSSLQFQQSNICNVIQDALLLSGLPADRLEIEVTESAAIDCFEETSHILRTLAQSGVKISLDDFGTGFSSLSYLHQLPLNKVKIDRSFVESIRDDDRSLVLLSGVTQMAVNLGLQVVVEGVEERDQLEILKSKVHFDQVQGYLFGKAMGAADIRAFLAAFGKTSTSTAKKMA